MSTIIIAAKALRYEGRDYARDEVLDPPPSGRLRAVLLEHRYVYEQEEAKPKPAASRSRAKPKVAAAKPKPAASRSRAKPKVAAAQE